MDLEKKIGSLEHSLFEKLKNSATEGSTSAALKYSRLLESLTDVKSQYAKIEEKTILIEKSIDDDVSTISSKHWPALKSSSTQGDSRVRAVMERKKFIGLLLKKGIILKQYKGKSLYQNSFGGVVGIAYASLLNNKWFLGLPVREYSGIVLMCEDEHHNPYRFILSENEISQYKKYFSSDSEHKQYKFNIIPKYGSFILKLKGGPEIELNSSIDSFDKLKSV